MNSPTESRPPPPPPARAPRADNRVLALYEVCGPAAEIEEMARALAVEQSVEMPLAAITDPRVVEEVVATVEHIEELAPQDDGRDHRTDRFAVTLGLAQETMCDPRGVPDVAQLWNMLFGNCSLMEHVRLLNVELPPPMLAHLGGPRVGVSGLRSICHAEGRALTCTALKPQGMAAPALAELCGRFAVAGLDLIKDDHGLADQPAAPFAERVTACQAAVVAANRATGQHARYAPSLVGSPTSVARQARLALELGVEVVLVAPALLGMAGFHELVRTELHGMAVLAHPAYAGAARVDPPLLLGSMFRLLGADATIFPNVGGRFSYSARRCSAIARAALEPWGDLAPCLPVPAGGMNADRVDELLDSYGTDVMLLIGGALLAAGEGLDAEARRFVAKVAGHR